MMFPARYSSLDLWRGVACLTVVIHHAATRADPAIEQITHYGRHGVTIFFVISGYCIAAAASRHRGSAVEYFRRRFARIFPPYWVALIGTAIMIGLLDTLLPEPLTHEPIPTPADMSLVQWLGNLTLTETWRWHAVWAGAGQSLLLQIAWTLCYEEQFYAVMGLAMLTKQIGVAVCVITLAVFCLALLPENPFVGFFFDGWWLAFAAGAAVYFWRAHSRAVTIPVMLLAGLAVVWLLPMRQEELLVAGVFAAVLFALRPYDTRLTEHAGLQWLLACGLRCYSIYLVHFPVTTVIGHVMNTADRSSVWDTVLLTIPIALSASVGLAWVFHAAVERQFMNAPVKDRPIETYG